MYQLYQVDLWTDEMVFVRAAIQAQYDSYCKRWRDTFIRYDADIAAVYLQAIHSFRNAMKEFDRILPPK